MVQQLKKIGEIKDPVQGYIWFTEIEKKLIDSAPMQRLRGVKQLAGAELTYPGAIHTRFIHSLGVMHISGLIGEHLLEKGYTSKDDVQILRLAGLLHDVGHGPFSHAFDEILEKYTRKTHESLTKWLVNESIIGELLEDNGFSKEKISLLAVGLNQEVPFFNQIICGHFASDIMDYLIRDSYFAGVEYGYFDVHRLVSSLDLIDNTLVADYSDALGVLESFIIARIEMFNVVYFHRSVRAANIMLTRAMDFAHETLRLLDFNSVEDFLNMVDERIIFKLLSLKKESSPNHSKAYSLITNFRSRKLLKSSYEIIIHHENDFNSNSFKDLSIRKKTENEIGIKAGVDPDFIFIDVPQVRSVPINPVEIKRTEMKVYKQTPNGKKVQGIKEASPILGAISQFIDIIRVYTLPEYRDQVTDACNKIIMQTKDS